MKKFYPKQETEITGARLKNLLDRNLKAGFVPVAKLADVPPGVIPDVITITFCPKDMARRVEGEYIRYKGLVLERWQAP